ncbi:MAG: hypothetical protein IJO52_08895 [Clostridia bacterium]|nr:hypothetical protein [Clostridia bacterium]
MNTKRFCFTVDDNIRVFKEICENGYKSIFEHPYLAMYKRLHEAYDLKVQLNLFYEMDGFTLSDMTDVYKNEWKDNSDWLKLSFHSRIENVRPYENSGYDEVYTDCMNIHKEIKRFAGEQSLGKTTTVHYCYATEEGISALRDNGIQGLLGLYRTTENPRISYQTTFSDAELIQDGAIVFDDGIAYAGIDIVMNLYEKEEIISKLEQLNGREFIKVMIHEQYFYPDYNAYQSDFENKISNAFACLCKNGYKSSFFEECF